MGVYKLWEILLTTAASKHPEDLSGMILAVDASLWIVKVNTIFQQQSAQIRCLFKKVLWLIQHNIKPVFVFDGTPPALKRKTLEQRRKRRRELNDFQITKKVELEILKKIQKPDAEDDSQSTATNRQVEQKQKQIDEMLKQLLKVDSEQPLQIQDKIALQGKVLDKKYQLYSQLVPNLLKKYGQLESFSHLDIETKLAYLEQIEQSDLPSGRQLRLVKKNLSEEQKMIYQMQMIKKKSEIRQLQDNLYRKVMKKKAENGYEIIEGIYKGKKVVQKRKIRDSSSFGQYGGFYSKKAPQNNLREIFNSKRENERELEIQKNQEDEDNQTDFFHKIFTKDFSNSNQEENSQNQFKSLTQRLSSKLKKKPKKYSDSQYEFSEASHRSNASQRSRSRSRESKKSEKEQKEQKEEDYFDMFRDHGMEKIEQMEKDGQPEDLENKDPDNFPDFIKMEELDYLNRTSNNNVQLQNILEMLGIPYVLAPAQAEAQCAYLEMIGIVDGVITQDSDVFLFGAKKVYRGVFQEKIKYYQMDSIERKLHLNRQKMILFALMLGSDYTDGVKGIGIVNAMEILKVHENLNSLRKFTEWAKSADDFLEQEMRTQSILNSELTQKQRQFYELHKKYKNYWHVHPNFPSQAVFDAYMKPPIIEKSQMKFKEERRLQIIQEIMREKFLMTQQEIDHNMKILKKQFKRKGQQTITEFLMGEQYARIRSKRLQKALEE